MSEPAACRIGGMAERRERCLSAYVYVQWRCVRVAAYRACVCAALVEHVHT